MIRSICILGRQPSLGIAELESLFGNDSLHIIGDGIVGLDIPFNQVAFERLGGTIKLCEVVGQMASGSWDKIEHSLLNNLDDYIPGLSTGKLQFGVSLYGINANIRQLRSTGIRLKQALKSSGQSVRLVPNQELQLNSAQVLHNKLTGERGIELVLVRDGPKLVVCRTAAVQDITAYTLRDRGRPKRDARVGMLPPKLAQIIVNLSNPSKDDILLDPFCGTGVVLQEAALMGLKVYGTDLEERMIDYTNINLAWLKDGSGLPETWLSEVGDATEHKWSDFDTVASEVYLGQAFSAFPSEDKLSSVINTCNKITEEFLKNIHPQLKDGARLCVAVPAWLNPKNNRFHHLPLLDHLEILGYNRVSFYHTDNRDLIYYRPGQIVGRELIVITRN